MTRDEFFQKIENSKPEALAREFFYSENLRIFKKSEDYIQFRESIGKVITDIDFAAIVGSANWRFSLNPEKNFREFGSHSDVDVAIVSQKRFHSLWEQMRENHRRFYYALSFEDKGRLRRNSENVYAGFISPLWIVRWEPKERYHQKKLLDTLSDATVGFLPVKILYFKNPDEAIDYYSRGFVSARRSIREIRRIAPNNRMG
jgi:hypothetical protein